MSGAFSYLLVLGLFYGAALGLFFGLKAVKLI
ncbi:MAG: cytochrome B6 [Trichocoleus desertorum ATA4-8-CV12]|nr:cytochrome B6 [Trichocoleus desertorum ATA4-8-CV12]